MRERLPNRRRSVAEDIVYRGHIITVHAGFNERDELREVFIRPQGKAGKTGTEFNALCTQFAVLMSNLLRNGTTIPQLHAMLYRLDDGEPASVAGAACDWLLQLTVEQANAR